MSPLGGAPRRTIQTTLFGVEQFRHAGPSLTAEDDAFHEHTDHWWETETAWFSFNVPERRMGGWFYNQVLAVQGVCNGGAWVWDDSDTPALYEVNQRGLPLPEGLDLRDVTLPNGNAMAVLEPLRTYRLRYRDPGRFEADVVFQAIMAPHSHPLGAAPFWKGRHFDQAGRVRGEIVLHGERIEVDCVAGRDRSWGPRPMGPDPRKARPAAPSQPKPRRPDTGIGYSFGSSLPAESFLVYTQPHEDGSDELTAGYLVQDGAYAPLVSGRRRVTFDASTRWITRIEIEAVDELGRGLRADGSLVSRHGAAGSPSGTGLFWWSWNGVDGWGEDQSYCSDAVWRAVGAPG
jgi:hypothetical protein